MAEPFIKPRFFIDDEKMWKDSWTYGDWRQYIVEHKDGSAQCVRLSRIPFLITALAFFIFIFLCFMLIYLPLNSRIGMGLIVCWAILSAMGMIRIKRKNFVVAVGPRMTEGKRLFWDEVENA